MLKIFAVMVCAMLLGWALKNKRLPRKQLSSSAMIVIIMMMFLIGIEMGASDSLITVFRTIIIDATLLSIGALSGTILISSLVNKFIIKSKQDLSGDVKNGSSYLFSLLIVGVFLLGVLFGYLDILSFLSDDAPMWALYLLMALVGFNIGCDNESLRALRSQPWRIIFVPLATITGTFLGVLAFSPFIGLSILDQLAIGSGMGYYSLSSVLLSELKGVEIGAIALMVNVMRELTTVVCAPLLARWFSPLSVICCGGATTLDVTLPVVIRSCGASFVGIALFQGVVVDLSVPFLVTFWSSLG